MKLFQSAIISSSSNSSAATDCAGQVLELIPAIMRRIRQQMRSSSSVELTVVQFRALAFLSRSHGASLSDVAEHVGLSLPTASKLVQTLIVRGYLHRHTNSTDRRRTSLAPTAKGRRILDVARKATRTYLAELLSDLSPGDCRRVVRALQSLRPIFLPEIGAREDQG